MVVHQNILSTIMLRNVKLQLTTQVRHSSRLQKRELERQEREDIELLRDMNEVRKF